MFYPIISKGWKPEGYLNPVINLQLVNAVKIIYDEPYKCHPHYQLHLQYQSVEGAESVERTIELQEKEFRSPNLLDIVFDKFENECGDFQFSRWIDPNESDVSDITHQFRHTIKNCAGDNNLIRIPFYGGWEYDKKIQKWFFYRPINQSMRDSLKARSFAYDDLSRLRPAPYLPKKVKDVLNTVFAHFEQVVDPEKRLFLFLYFHYTYFSSLLGRINLADVLCLDISNQVLRSNVITFLFGDPRENWCEIVQENLPKKQFLQRFKETKDIPFLIESSAYAERCTLRAKVAALQNELNSSYTCNNCVPIVFSAKSLDVNGMLHLTLTERDFAGYSNIDIRTYIDILATSFVPVQISTVLKQMNCQNSALHSVLQTTFDALRLFYENNGVKIDPWLENHSSIDDFLTWTLAKYSSNISVDGECFLDELEKLIGEDVIVNLSEAANGKEMGLDIFDNKACVRWNEERSAWEVNAIAFEEILQGLDMPVSTYQVLRALEQERRLCAPKINRNSYQSRIRFEANGRTAQYRNAYVIKGKSQMNPTHNLSEPDWTSKNTCGYTFCFGQSIKTGKAVNWLFQKNANRHMRILGASGQGKSVFLETMLQQAAQKRIMTVIVHLQGKLPEIDGAQVINIAEHFSDVSIEDPNITNQYANYFRQSLRLSDTYATLIERTLTDFCKNNAHPTMRRFITSFRDMLNSNGGNRKKVKDALNLMADSRAFSGDVISWNDCIGKTTILNMQDFKGSSFMLSVYMEILLASLYQFQKARLTYSCVDTDVPLIIAIDEFQQFNPAETSILFEIIREGRMFDCCLWLTTQILTSKMKRITDQMNTSVYFNQGQAENAKAAQVLESTSKGQALARTTLQDLKIGEHIVSQIGNGWIVCAANKPFVEEYTQRTVDLQKIWNV